MFVSNLKAPAGPAVSLAYFQISAHDRHLFFFSREGMLPPPSCRGTQCAMCLRSDSHRPLVVAQSTEGRVIPGNQLLVPSSCHPCIISWHFRCSSHAHVGTSCLWLSPVCSCLTPCIICYPKSPLRPLLCFSSIVVPSGRPVVLPKSRWGLLSLCLHLSKLSSWSSPLMVAWHMSFTASSSLFSFVSCCAKICASPSCFIARVRGFPAFLASAGVFSLYFFHSIFPTCFLDMCEGCENSTLTGLCTNYAVPRFKYSTDGFLVGKPLG